MENQPDNGWSNPDNWVWGLFYFNPKDERIFPPKRIPWMGWTINFAKPKSVLAMLAMFAFFGFVIYMIETHGVN